MRNTKYLKDIVNLLQKNQTIMSFLFKKISLSLKMFVMNENKSILNFLDKPLKMTISLQLPKIDF